MGKVQKAKEKFVSVSRFIDEKPTQARQDELKSYRAQHFSSEQVNIRNYGPWL